MSHLGLPEFERTPDAFAIVMATGIVSVAARDHHYHLISVALGVVALIAFAVLAVDLAANLAVRRRQLLAQAHDPDVALRMFTFVAACAVLDERWSQHRRVGWAFDALAALGWLALLPLAAVDVRSRPRADLRDHAHGAWLLASVATSGVANAVALVAGQQASAAWTGLAIALWVLALVLYVAVAWLIVWRVGAASLRAEQVTPDSWILMGALAIAALAGASIVEAGHAAGMSTAGLHDATLAVWALAALWVPLLLYLEVWTIERAPGSLHYQGVWWSAVFPLGMFAASSAACSHALSLRALFTVSLVFFWVAFAVWLTVFTGSVHALVGRAATRRSSTDSRA